MNLEDFVRRGQAAQLAVDQIVDGVESQWIRFQLAAQQNPKTQVWEIITKESDKETAGHVLARVSWFGRWRRYALFPEPGTVFEPTCLRDIATFIDGLMVLRRGGASR